MAGLALTAGLFVGVTDSASAQPMKQCVGQFYVLQGGRWYLTTYGGACSPVVQTVQTSPRRPGAYHYTVWVYYGRWHGFPYRG